MLRYVKLNFLLIEKYYFLLMYDEMKKLIFFILLMYDQMKEMNVSFSNMQINTTCIHLVIR